MNLAEYENIVYDFYPDKERIDLFFDQYPTVYDYKLHQMAIALNEKLSR